MKIYNRFINNIQSFSNALLRFPLTAAFLIAIAVLDAMMINNNGLALEKYIISLALGAFLSAALQMVYERFYVKNITRIAFMAIAGLLALVYYLTIMNEAELGQDVLIKTLVVLFGLFIAFLWIPSIKNKITFNECFMASFKAFFIAFLFSGVLMGGFSIIYGATDVLLFEVNEDIYSHTANIVFVVFATMYFLSLTPKYQHEIDVNKQDNSVEELDKATSTPKILEILISYIVIPMSMVFTLILLIYIATNISGSFWSDALLEPMLVSYIVAVILIYILASRMGNRMAGLFRKIFPKVLIPIVIFQTINSVLRIGDFGLTFGRYYVILFGLFAFIAGLVFSFKPVEKNGIVPMVLIICIVISVLPMIDAFTISKNSQINILENVLVENEMLKDGKIIPKGDIDESDKKRITAATEYLQNMGYVDDIEWFPEDYDDFEKTFGFSRYEKELMHEGGFSLRTDMYGVTDISGYDYFVETHISNYDYGEEEPIKYKFEKNNEEFTLLEKDYKNDVILSLYDSENNELVSINSADIISQFENYSLNNETMPIEDAYVISENENGTIKILVQYIEADENDEGYGFNAEIYVFIKVE
ncbi:MAG: DUF4153 domain-containing protein [Peptostreptococcaceae bacterium]|nr:DUF4153 domain-containing protein [Peptostreptococcaceae bacterium]